MTGLKYIWTAALSLALLANTARANIAMEVDVNGKIDEPTGAKEESVLQRLLSLVENAGVSSAVQPKVGVEGRTRRLKNSKGGKGYNSANDEDEGDEDEGDDDGNEDDDEDNNDDDEVEGSSSGSGKGTKSSKGSKSSKVRETHPVTFRETL